MVLSIPVAEESQYFLSLNVVFEVDNSTSAIENLWHFLQIDNASTTILGVMQKNPHDDASTVHHLPREISGVSRKWESISWHFKGCLNLCDE